MLHIYKQIELQFQINAESTNQNVSWVKSLTAEYLEWRRQAIALLLLLSAEINWRCLISKRRLMSSHEKCLFSFR
jgi:hypothetical protein